MALRRYRFREQPAMPSLFGLAPGGVCRAVSVAGNAVRSYRTFSPLLVNTRRRWRAVRSLWHFPWGRPRRMLSGTVCRWSPDFPLRPPFDVAGAAVRPTDPTGMEVQCRGVKINDGDCAGAACRRSGRFRSGAEGIVAD